MSETADQATKRRACACIRDDRHDCWRARYSMSMCESVEADGGPCECSCHDEHDDEDRP